MLNVNHEPVAAAANRNEGCVGSPRRGGVARERLVGPPDTLRTGMSDTVRGHRALQHAAGGVVGAATHAVGQSTQHLGGVHRHVATVRTRQQLLQRVTWADVA